jgi:large subunit ribosomal protein L30
MAKKEKVETIKIQQIGSPIRREKCQLVNLKSLGLGKMNRIREVENTPSIQGLIRKVSHMVRVLDK